MYVLTLGLILLEVRGKFSASPAPSVKVSSFIVSSATASSFIVSSFTNSALKDVPGLVIGDCCLDDVDAIGSIYTTFLTSKNGRHIVCV